MISLSDSFIKFAYRTKLEIQERYMYSLYILMDEAFIFVFRNGRLRVFLTLNKCWPKFFFFLSHCGTFFITLQIQRELKSRDVSWIIKGFEFMILNQNLKDSPLNANSLWLYSLCLLIAACPNPHPFPHLLDRVPRTQKGSFSWSAGRVWALWEASGVNVKARLCVGQQGQTINNKITLQPGLLDSAKNIFTWQKGRG